MPDGSMPAAGTYQVSATQNHPAIGAQGDHSDAVSRPIEIDNVQPDPPTIVSPAGGYGLVQVPATFSGTSAEPAGIVSVYLDDSPVPACEAEIAGGTWECVGGHDLSRGAHRVQARQQDVAGNIGGFSESRRFFVGSLTAEPPVAPTPTPSPTASASAPPPSTPDESPSPSPLFPRADGTGPSLEEALTNWGSSTGFGAALATPQESLERGNWLRAPLLALGAILLIALPLRLLTTSLRGRIRSPFGQITGRNRPGPAPEDQHLAGPNPWLAGLVPLAVATAFISISGGISGEVRYLRLTFAVGVALAALNLVGVALVARLGYRWQGVDGRLRFLPLLLVAAAVTGLLSRLTGLVPPIVTGVLIGVRFAHDTPLRKRALVNLLQPVAVLLIAVLAWIGHGMLGPVLGFWPSLLSETFAAACLAGIGSAFVMMLPVGPLPGRVILEWSPWAWLGVALVGATAGFGILLGGATSHFPLAATLLIAIGFAAACVVVWAWLRFVRPAPALR